MKKIKPIIAGTTFMLVFGFIDNLFLLIGMESLDSLMSIDPLINGMLGNTFSDAIGVILGGSLSYLISRLLKIKEDQTTFIQQLFGITLGCLIPVIFVLGLSY